MLLKPGRGHLLEVLAELVVEEPSLRLLQQGRDVGLLPFLRQRDFPEPPALLRLRLCPLPILRALVGTHRRSSRDRQLLSGCRARRGHAVQRATRRWTRQIDPQHLERELWRPDSQRRYRHFLLHESEGPTVPHCASKNAD